MLVMEQGHLDLMADIVCLLMAEQCKHRIFVHRPVI